MLTLKGELRDPKKKLAAIRAEGFIPAVYYGHKEAATPCVVNLGEFTKVFRVAGESTVITLETPKGNVNVLVHDVQLDPVRSFPTHVDFYVIEKGQEVSVDIPLEFAGVAPAAKELGANVIKVLHSIEVKALPENLPHTLAVDLALLAGFDAKIFAKDVVLPAHVTLVTNPDEVVATATAAKEESETSAPADFSTIEVEKKGKKEEEATESES